MRALLLRRPLCLALGLGAAVVLAPQLADAEDPPAAAGEQLEPGVEQTPQIYGGTAAKPCGWPTAVYLSFGGAACSGTLVHPDVVITAAHCPNSTTGRPATVGFGEGFGGGARQVGATCFSNPGWTGQVGDTDYGYCLLNESVTDVPIIPPAWGCDTSALTPGREVVIVGFGQSDNGGSGSKREVTTTIQAISSQAVVGGGGKDACQGDSGGPVYIKMGSEFGGDDTWRAFGITSGGGQCGQGGIFALMHVAIPWIEQHSGIDITPCHDSEGNWAPTPLCGSIPLDPANGQGSWATGCSDGPVSGFVGLCGDPFGTGEDEDPPSVEIVMPGESTTFMIPEGETQVDVDISAVADDGEGFGVADVRLLINGNEFPGNADSSEPYEWGLVFPAGGFIVEAVATDYVGNEAVSAAIAIGVDQEPPELPEGGGDEGGDTGGGTSGGGDEVGDTGGDLGIEGRDQGCACSSADRGASGAPALAFGLLGLGLGLLRRRRG